MTEQIFFTIVGAALGFFLSIFFWWYWNHRIVPRIEFSEQISRRPYERSPGGWLFRVKFKNTGRRRAIDVNILCRIGIYELGAKKTWNWYEIKTNAERIPSIKPGGNRLVIMRPEETEDFKRNSFPKEIRELFASGKLTIEHLLALGTKAKITVHVFAYDEFSGARKLYTSPGYTKESVLEGVFRGLTLSRYVKGESVYSEIDYDDSDAEQTTAQR